MGFEKDSTRVLIALQRFQVGGAERQALYLAEGLMKRGYEVTIFAFGRAEGLGYDRFKTSRANTICSEFNEKVFDFEKTGWKARWQRWLYSRKLISLITSVRPDIILAYTYRPNIIFGTLWRKMGAKACYWNQRDEGRWFKGKPHELHALSNCTSVLSNNMEGKLFLEKFLPIEVQIIHNGVRMPETIADPAKPGEIKVVMVANLKSYKDHNTLLKAWKIILSNQPEISPKLILIGRKGDTAKSLRKFVLENNMDKSVVFRGQVADVNALIRTCHIGVFSSITEGLPNGILECMAIGLPVIATRIIGTEEALGEDYPYLCKPKDHEEMANKLNILLQDSAERVLIGKMNRERVEKYFGMEMMVTGFKNVIESGTP
jgi:glycosyltransferase involved in cell wall biosynthesis